MSNAGPSVGPNVSNQAVDAAWQQAGRRTVLDTLYVAGRAPLGLSGICLEVTLDALPVLPEPTDLVVRDR